MKRTPNPTLRGLEAGALRSRLKSCCERIRHRLAGQSVSGIRAWRTRYLNALLERGEATE